MVWLYIGIAVVVLLIIYVFTLINRFIRYENAIDNAWGQIDVQLQRRGELIPNLVETVKGYAKHERATFEAVSNARAAMIGAKGPVEKMEADNILGAALGKLFAISEAYPELKANQNFLQMQDELSHTENKISFARQAYNDSVQRYNDAIETYPAKWVAGSRKEKPMLAVPEASKVAPKVSF